jgi:hypothetical protein
MHLNEHRLHWAVRVEWHSCGRMGREAVKTRQMPTWLATWAVTCALPSRYTVPERIAAAA